MTMLADFRTYAAPAIRPAYDLLLRTRNYELVPTWAGQPGRKRAVSFRRAGSSARYYSFIVNRNWLLFYIRSPAWCREWDSQGPALTKRFGDDFWPNARGEWHMRIRTTDEVGFIVARSRETPYPIDLN